MNYLQLFTHTIQVAEDVVYYYDYLEDEDATRPTDAVYREGVRAILNHIDEKLQDTDDAKYRGHMIGYLDYEHNDYDDELWAIWVDEINAWNTNNQGKFIEIGDGSGLLNNRELNYCSNPAPYRPYNRETIYLVDTEMGSGKSGLVNK